MQAIVILTHKLNSSIYEKFKLLSEVEGFDCFVLFDNTRSGNIQDFAMIRTFNLSDIKRKYNVFEQDRLVPGSNHLPVIDFILKNSYGYVWSIEFDCIFKGEWKNFFKAYTESKADLITAEVRTKEQDFEWDWWNYIGLPVELSDTELYGSFNPVYRMSKSAAEVLYKQNKDAWHAHHEITMVTGLKYVGKVVEELKHCNERCYSYKENLLDREYISKTENILVHPVK